MGWTMTTWGVRIGPGPRALALAAGLAGLAGCGQMRQMKQQMQQARLPAPAATAALTDMGPTARVTARNVADVEFALGRTLEQQENFEKAEAAYRAVLAKDPRRADVMARLAILMDRKGNFAESAEFYRKALASLPNDPEIHCDRGYSFYLQRRWSDAEASLRKALALKSDMPRAHSNLGLVLARQGRQDEALAAFRRAGLDDADARANLALALGLEGRWLESRQQYGKALTAKPNSPAAKEGVKATTSMLVGGKATDPSVARAGATGRTTATAPRR
jgi:tetratricopeptide (TPR) repeat protein